MENSAKKKLIKILPAAIMLAVIALLAGLSFLPCFRGNKATVSATASNIDAEAMRVLGCCSAYCAANDFDTELGGKIKARVFGVPYTQTVRGGRQVRGDGFTDIAESVSVFAKAGIKKSCVGGEYCVIKGVYDDGAFSYGDGDKLDRAGYVGKYGKPSVGLVKYELDNAIIGAEVIGENAYRYVLDAARATAYCRNEVKTILGLGSFPEYEAVEFTLYTDGECAHKITCVEQFRIDKFGGAFCRAEYTETFSPKA